MKKITLELPESTFAIAVTAMRGYKGEPLAMTTRIFANAELHDGADLKVVNEETDDGQSKAD